MDMSSGGPGEDRELETEAELARKQVNKFYSLTITDDLCNNTVESKQRQMSSSRVTFR